MSYSTAIAYRLQSNVRNEPSVLLNVALTYDDARALLALCERIGGDPDKSARGMIEQVRQSLYKLEVTPNNAVIREDYDSPVSIIFEEGHPAAY